MLWLESDLEASIAGKIKTTTLEDCLDYFSHSYEVGANLAWQF